MQEMIEIVKFYFSFPFVIYAFIVGVLIALSSSLLGVTLVLKRFSYISDGLSHVAFGALSVATVLRIAGVMWLVFPATAVCAILLLRRGQNAKTRGDAAIAMLSVGALAIGYLVMNLFPVSTNLAGDVCTTLFGATSILTLTPTDVWMCIILSLLVLAIFVLYYNRIFAVTFDETFAKATGMKVEAFNLLLAVVIAAVIVLAMNLVGSLLISALVIFPAMSAMRLFHNFKIVIIASAIISIFCAVVGLLSSIFVSVPVGSGIVCMNIIVFFIACFIRKIRGIK